MCQELLYICHRGLFVSMGDLPVFVYSRNYDIVFVELKLLKAYDLAGLKLCMPNILIYVAAMSF